MRYVHMPSTPNFIDDVFPNLKSGRRKVPAHTHRYTQICFVCDMDGTLCDVPGCLTCIRCGDFEGEEAAIRETERAHKFKHRRSA